MNSITYLNGKFRVNLGEPQVPHIRAGYVRIGEQTITVPALLELVRLLAVETQKGSSTDVPLTEPETCGTLYSRCT